jgi:protein-tyrosine phosphatase
VIDTHCHLLPALDDGPSSHADSIQLARMLAAEGVTRVLCTPHYSARYPTSTTRASERIERLRGDLAAIGIQLELALAAEVSVERVLHASADELDGRSVAGRFVLVELASDVPRGGPAAVADRLEGQGLAPVFAHPERWLANRHAIDVLDELCSRGAWLQVVAASLVGSSRPEVWETAWELVASGRADVVASDAHRAGGRRVQLRALADLLDSRAGPSRRRDLLEDAPGRLLAGLPRAELAAT